MTRRWPLALPLALPFALLLGASSCARSGLGTRTVLREYQVVAPRRQLAHPVWLTSFTSDELGGRLSQDGRRLLYAGNQKGNLELWIKDLRTGLVERLTDHEASDTQPTWDPADRRVAFISMRQDAKGDLFLWDKGKLTRLTERDTAEAFPMFSPDGRALYFASGPEGLSRIERLELTSKRREALTGWDATHPAISPDGQLLAYTQFDRERRGRIALMRLADRRVRLLTTADYHAGFPAFSPDGARLVYSRFTLRAPDQPLDPEAEDAVASLWEVDVQRAQQAASPALAQALAQPLTSGRSSALFVQVSPHGLVFTSRQGSNLDMAMLPSGGPVPHFSTVREQLDFALAQEHPLDELLGLYRLHGGGSWPRGPSAEASLAFYRAATLHRTLGQFAQAERALSQLAGESPLRHGEVAYLAEIDRAALPVERLAAAPGGQRAQLAAAVRGALSKLAALPLPRELSPRVGAHLLLRRGDLEQQGGQQEAALASYEAVVSRYPSVRDHAVQAKLQMGRIFAALRAPDLLAIHYLELFHAYPEQVSWLRQAAAAALELYAGRPAAEQVERLRSLVDRYRHLALFGALAELRIAKLYEEQGQIELAIQAAARVSSGYPGPRLVNERTAAAFELGRLSLANYEQLRQAGRLSEALSSYDRALAAYRQVVESFEPGHEYHRRARGEYLRLSLLMVHQLERDGELAMAEKRCQAILQLAPDNLQAHRKLIELGVRRGEGAQLVASYRAQLRADPGNAVAYYALGYLATLATPLTAERLREAEQQLKRAIDLNPQSPFGHMTLGWVYEMRERYLGETGRGWLEEALELYDRAYGLNDAALDGQTEADLLINLCNGFANLGNGWPEAYRFCRRRNELKLPFLSRERAAAFHLTFGRAATAVGKHELADKELEQAYDLARDLGKRQLEVEAVARLGFNAYLQGDRQRSNRFLEQARTLYRRNGHVQALARLDRVIADNLVSQGRDAQALRQLTEAQQQLRQHGTAAIAPFSPLEGSCEQEGCTTAPFGFNALDESYLHSSLREQVYRRGKAWPEVLPLLERRIATRAQALRQSTQQELGRELLLLENERALTQLKLGRPQLARAALERALRSVQAMQTTQESSEEVTNALLYTLRVALALNRSELVLGELARGAVLPLTELQAALRELRELEQRKTAQNEPAEAQLLGPRLRLALWTDLALLNFHVGLRQRAAAARPAAATAKPAARAVERLLRVGQPFISAVRLLRQALAETDPERITEEPEALAEARAVARERGVLAPLLEPLAPRERLRWHVLAGLDLATLTTAFVPERELASHPTSELLSRLAALGVRHELGALRFAVTAERAWREGDAQAMEAAVRGFLQRSPLLLDESYPALAAQLRRFIFGRAVDLALRLKQYGVAVAWAEEEERRGFVDELLTLPPEGYGAHAQPLERLLAAAAAYRRQLAREELGAAENERAAAWRTELTRLEHAVDEQRRALAAVAPRLGALLETPPFPAAQLQQALAAGDVAITALPFRDRLVLVALRSSGAPVALTLEPALSRLRTWGARQDIQLAQTLRPALARLSAGAQRVYLDLGRLSPELAAEPWLPASVRAVRLATLWELVDAHDVRNLSFGAPLLVDHRPAEAQRLARALGISALPAAQLAREGLGRRLEPAGVLVLSAPLRFDGERAVNLRLLLDEGQGARLGDLRLAQTLGLPLRGHLLVLVAPGYVPGQERAEQVALMRLVHAMGVPAVLIVPDARTLVRELRPLLAELPRRELAALLQRATHAGTAVLHGYGGMAPSEAQLYAKRMLDQTARAGVSAFTARQLPAAVEHLEATLRYMEYLQDFKYQDGALEFLAQSYTLLEDYARAVPLMERLLALRAKNVAELQAKGGPPLLAAQAKWVKSLKDMAWLRMRNKQYDQALAANAQAIAFYLQLKRPLLAQSSYDQRSLIAEEKGDAKEALSYAIKALETARAGLAQQPKSAAARATVAGAAQRVARYQRMLFSDYPAAMQAAQLALEHLPAVTAEELPRLQAKREALAADPRQAKELAALTARGRELRQALDDRLQSVLEICRIQSARGDYTRAVERAEEALELARRAGLPLPDAALLELVNNLYYLGSYGPALARAGEGLRLVQQPLRRIQFYNVRGTIYAALGRTTEAAKEIEAALAIARRLNNLGEMAASHNNLGNAYRLAGRFAEAKAQFAQALELDQRQANRFGMSFDYANLGLAEALMGRAGDAQAHLQQALTLSRSIGARLNELKALLGLGQLALRSGRAQPALEHAQQGAKLATALGLRNWSWRFQLLAARALRRLDRPALAQQELEQGLATLEQGPPRLRKARGVPKVEEEPEDLYDELIDLLAASGRAEAAFDLSERMRGRAFIDLLGHNLQELPLAEARRLIQQVSGLQRELEAVRAAQMRGGSAAVAEQELVRLQAALRDARTALAALNPRLPELVLNEAQSLSQLRPLLAQQSALLISYAVLPERLLIWTLRGGALKMYSVAVKRAELERTVSRLREALMHFHPERELAEQLYRWLLAPVLAGPTPQQLVIVPAGPLHLVPFAALHDGKDYVVARHSVAYLSSVNALRRLSAARSAPPARRVAFGWAGAAPRPLSFTVREAAAFGAAFPAATVVEGPEATRARFLAEAKDAQLLHVATHATYREEAPLQTSLELADGELPLLEVLGLALRPDALVILSACQTGTGELDGADAVVGLHQAFLAAGARQVISSLWRVSDLGAALLMKHVFRRLAAGQPPADALREAQHQLRRRFAHPAFWAAFRLDGVR